MSISVNPHPRNSPRYWAGKSLRNVANNGQPLHIPFGERIPGSRLTPIKRVDNTDTYSSGRKILCKCSCGNETVGYASAIMKLHKKSCGCLAKKTTKAVKKIAKQPRVEEKKVKPKGVRLTTEVEYPNGRVVKLYVDNGQVISDSHPEWESNYIFDEAKAVQTESLRKDPRFSR